MHSLPPLIYDLMIMLCIAGLITLLCQRIHQPVVLGYLIAGIIIGPYTPPYALVHDLASIKTLSELGVIFLMFSLGLEFSFHKLAKVGFSSCITGLFEVVLMLFIGFYVGKLLGWSFNDCLFLGAALSISSTTIIIKAIDELGLTKKRFAEIIFGILVVEDLLAILLLVALSTIVTTKNILSLDILWAAGKLILVIGGWFIAGYFLIPPFLRRIMQYANDETLILVSIGLCLLLVSVAVNFHYSAALGAFIMGSILAETPLIHRIETNIKPIRNMFAAIFFISIGMLIDPQVIIQNWQIVLLFTVITIIGKLLSTGLGAFLSGQSLTTSLRVGFGMAQVGEFSFIIIGLGFVLKAINEQLYPIIVAVAGITTFTTPYLIRYSDHLAKKLDANLSEETKHTISQYSAAIYKLQSNTRQKSILQKVMLRFIPNAIIVAIIFKLCDTFIFPQVDSHTNPWFADVISWLVAMIISSPFLWGMLFSFKPISALCSKKSLKIMHFSIWSVTLFEIIVLSIAYFESWVITTLLIGTTLLFFGLMHNTLGKTYHWFERHFINNIKKEIAKNRYELLAPWDTHLIDIYVSALSPLVDKTLHENKIRQNYGINIVAIYRGQTIIVPPRGVEKLLAHDKLIVLGNDEQLEAFKKLIEIQPPQAEVADHLEHFSLKTILLEQDHTFIGKTIKESGIREKVSGLIVGIEHNGNQILNPDSKTTLHAGDLLVIVGKSHELDTLS